MIVGVDTGGTKTLVAIFDENGKIARSDTFPTPKDTSIYVDTLVSSIGSLVSADEIEAISIAVPGAIRDNIIELCINLGWRNYDLISELKDSFPNVKYFIDNDANLGGVGEVQMLTESPDKCLYITLGTGVGCGFVYHGSVAPALNDSEAGHMLFLEDDEEITWEELVGGKRLLSEFGSIHEIKDQAIFDEIGRRVAKGLVCLLPTFRPELVIVGGGIGAYFDRFSSVVRREIDKLIPDFQAPVVEARYPKEAVAYGCYFEAKNALKS